MPEDLKKLESLDYKPECYICGNTGKKYKDPYGPDCPLCRPASPPGTESYLQSTSARRATLGFNSAVIKPEMRVNKREDAGQGPERKRLKNEKYYHQPHCNAPSHVEQFAKGVSCSCRQNIKIIPDLRVNKIEDAGQGPECKMCNDTGRTTVICRPLDEEIPQYVPCKYCEKGKEYCDSIVPNWKKQVRGPIKANYYPLSCDKPEQPSQIIEEIEGLISQVNEKLIKLSNELSVPRRNTPIRENNVI